ncbi:MAG: adenylyl-sulfate kinase [Desulfobaccales bacterium]
MIPKPYGARTENVVWWNGQINRADRNTLNNHGSGLIWLTGLSAGGKSTIAHGVEKSLFEKGVRNYVLDGDNIRHGLNRDLSFIRKDRKENIRRIAEISKLFVDAGIIVLASFITPYPEDRKFIKDTFEGDHFYLVYVKCSIETCIRRDPKGMYAKALGGIIKDYTGISAPYFPPEDADLIIDTEAHDIETSIQCLVTFLYEKGLIPEI